MAFSEEGGNMVMPVSPMGGYGNYGGNGGWGMNGDGFWIILLFLLLIGNNGWGGYGFGGGENATVQRGFDQAALTSSITGVQNGVNGLATQLCNGFATTNATINAGFANAETAANARAIASMQNMNALATQFSNCCCENRLGLADLKYTVATENCADRSALSDGVRDIITNQTAGIQRILDQLCNDKIDAKNERIADLERQLTMANLAASQTAQTSRILADNNAQTVALEQYLNPTPIPAYIVQNPACACNGGTGCGSF